MILRDYYNLSNGFIHLANSCAVSDTYGICHIRSEDVRKNRYASALGGVSDDLLFHLAQGVKCVIHDQSDKNRKPLAIWKGLPFVRYCLERAWDLEISSCIINRVNDPRAAFDARTLFDHLWVSQVKAHSDRIRYYRRYLDTDRVKIAFCRRRYDVKMATSIRGMVDYENPSGVFSKQDDAWRKILAKQ